MSDNRGHDWLDDATAERLLPGAHGDDPAERTWRDERAAALAGLLAAAAAPGPLDPEREEAAVAAFRAARAEAALTEGSAGVRLGTADDWSPGAGTDAGSRSGRNRAARHSRSLTGTLIATAAAAVAGVSVAAAAGALPALLGHAVPAPAPVHTQSAATAAPDSAPPAPSRPGHGSDRPSGGAGATHGTAVPGRTAGTTSAPPVLDHEALCRAYAAAGWHRKGVDEQAYKQLRKAAGGGGQQVRRYCAGLLGWEPGSSGNANSGNGSSGNANSGNANSGNGNSMNGNGGKAGKGDESGDAPRVTSQPALAAPASPAAPADGRPGPHPGRGGE
ncbi:hypothetical protein [Actinacidiphila sp. bgisy160]|uniref:hypothetical protein n=1 Tax=Actinacidiphila sp. bgisy160 TaxID=3413796 RepID=UPI003D741D06